MPGVLPVREGDGKTVVLGHHVGDRAADLAGTEDEDFADDRRCHGALLKFISLLMRTTLGESAAGQKPPERRGRRTSGRNDEAPGRNGGAEIFSACKAVDIRAWQPFLNWPRTPTE